MAKFIFLLTTGLLAQTPPRSGDAVLYWNETAVEHQEHGRFEEAHQAYKRAIEAADIVALKVSDGREVK